MAPLKCMAFALVTSGLLGSGTAQAVLVDRGLGMLYDTTLNITWLQDANYARTSVYDADGKMTFAQASSWAANLIYGGFTDWRLPSVSPVNNLNWNYNFSYNGSTDFAYNIRSPQSELAFMYYVNLNLKGSNSITGQYPQPGYGIFGNGREGGQNNVGLVRNLQSASYWTDTAYGPSASGYQMEFDEFDGYQTARANNNLLYAWAVRDGDVLAPPVPEPQTYAMMLAGLGLLGLWARRKKKSH